MLGAVFVIDDIILTSMMEKKQKTYNYAIDVLRVLSILAVIMIHTTTRTLESTNYDLHRLPWTLFLNQASRFAVPMFIMISGFVLELNYNNHSGYVSFLRKRLGKILLPYLLWSALYYLLIFRNNSDTFLESLLKGNASYQLYFIPTVLLFYLFFPLIRKLYPLFSKRWILVLLGIMQIIPLAYDYYVKEVPIYFPLSVTIMTYYVFLLGIYAARNEEKILKTIAKWKKVLTPITLLLAIYVYLEGEHTYFSTHYYQSFYSQWRPSVLIYTICLAGILHYYLKNKDLHLHIIKKLSRLSFFVFFVHIIILEAVWYPIVSDIFRITQTHIAETIWFDPLYFFLTAFFSFSLAYLIHKLPIINKLTG